MRGSSGQTMPPYAVPCCNGTACLLLFNFAKAPGQDKITKASVSSVITVVLFQPYKGAIFWEERLSCVSQKLWRWHGEGWGLLLC